MVEMNDSATWRLLYDNEGIIKTKIDYDAVTGLAKYIGSAPRGAATSSKLWRIQYFAYDANGSCTDILWSTSFVKWDDRTTVTYA